MRRTEQMVGMERLRQVSAHAAFRPAMYFSSSNEAAVAPMLRHMIHRLAQQGDRMHKWKLRLKLATRSPSAFELQIDAYGSRSLNAIGLPKWFPKMNTTPMWELEAAAGLCRRFALEIGTTKRRSRVSIKEGGLPSVATLKPNGRNRLLIRGELAADRFGTLSLRQADAVGGYLRDLCALNPGLGASLIYGPHQIHRAWHFPDGLAGYLCQADYTRHSLHPEVICIAGKQNGMEVELALRFVHSGPSSVTSWVNGWPVQGGAHLEGLGDALVDVFPDSNGGCRPIPFITNTDTQGIVWLPHSFVGALKLAIPTPLFAGPTRDIVVGEQVRQFVRGVVAEPLRAKWETERRRHSESVSAYFRANQRSGEIP